MNKDEKGILAGRLFALTIVITFFVLAGLYSVSRVGAQEENPGPVHQPTATPAQTETESEPTPEPQISVPASPEGLRASTETGSLDVSLDWNDVPGATHYLVRWRAAGPGNKLNTGGEVQTSNAKITLADFGEWVVRVEACNSAGCGPHLSVRFGVDPAAASTPTPEATPEPTPEATPEPTPEATPEPTPEATPEPTPEATPEPTPEATPEPAPEATPEPAPEATPEPTPEATPEPAPEATPETPTGTNLVPIFSIAISGLSFQEGEDAGDTTLPEADGGDGALSYSLTPALPEGLSFDSSTRVISGTPAGSGEFAMTYTAADEDGDQASFGFTINVQPATRTAKQNLLPTPRNLSVTRKQFSGTSALALNVSWDAPVHDQANLGYSLRYGAKGKGWVTPYLGFDSGTTSTTLSNLTAGTEYQVQVRVKYAVDGFSEWSYFNATTNSTPQTTTGYYYVKDHVVGVTYRG